MSEQKKNNMAQPRIGYAREMARKLLKDAQLTEIPINLNALIVHLQSKHSIKLVGWAFPNKIDGIQITESNEATIGFNNTKHIHRQRFTIAHEIGHFVLGHTRDENDFNLDSTNSNEIEANTFGAELLLPLTFLKRSLKEYKGSCENVSRLYQVSLEALWWKVKAHNLYSLTTRSDVLIKT